MPTRGHHQSRLLLAETSLLVVSHIQSSGLVKTTSDSGVSTKVSSEGYDASMGVRGAGMLFALLGDGPLTSLLDLLTGDCDCGCALPLMTAALGIGCSIQATSSGLAILRVVGGCRWFTAG